MQINPEILKESNYEGSRLFEVNDETVLALQEQLTSLQKEINPVLDKLNENYYSKADALYKEVNELNEKIAPLKEELKKLAEANKEDTDFLEKKDQEAVLIMNKLQPLITALVKDELGEFETAKNLTVKDGKIYVEIFDEIEEKVKAIRAQKAKNAETK